MITRREIYLDCNATHPLLPAVRASLADAILHDDPALGNPSSIHRRGQKTKKAVAEFRDALCRSIGRGDGDEFVLLSGATEALNLALRGFAEERVAAGRRPFFVTSSVEHSAVLDTIASLPHPSAVIAVDRAGALLVEPMLAAIEAALARDEDVLLTLQLANNETGVAFDLDTLLSEIHARFAPRPLTHLPKEKGGRHPLPPRRVWVLLDAAQALGKLEPARMRRALHHADYAAFSAHKIGGPSGMGALWLRPGAPFARQMTGGTQERKRRAGTLNSLGSLGFRLALEAWFKDGETWRARMQSLRDSLALELARIPGLVLHGVGPDGSLPALPNTLNFHVDGCPEESLLLALDLDGFCVSSGSACNSGTLRPSHVLLAMGYTREEALSSVRVCLGIETTAEDVKAFAESVRKSAAHILESRERCSQLLPEIQSV